MASKSDNATPSENPENGESETGSTETMGFQAEVGRLLDIVANALYSEREIFLRELISNAADACDKLRYLAIETPALSEGDSDYAITLDVDRDAGTLTVSDNGIGMNRDELIGNLGTIARSGSSAFVDNLTGDQKKDVSLIGQFGVGFYSAYMVSDLVSVESQRAGEEGAWRWTSDGRGEFTVQPVEKDGRGTAITMHLKEDAKEFLKDFALEKVVKTYSDHIPFPIRLVNEPSTAEEGADDADTEAQEDAEETRQLNTGGALWTRSKSEIEDQQYTEFYRHTAHAFDEPWMTVHFKAEGMIEYAGLLFVPSERPFDLFNPERLSKVKLYVKRVFITEECDELLPSWLRFLRGVVDSEDLPLNISREMLQNNPVLSKIRSGVVKRVLGDLVKKAEDDKEGYEKFWETFGLVLKEGLYESGGDQEQILKLARFRSTTQDGLTSLADYISRMKDGQTAIYYISGEDKDALAKSPQLEGFAAKGVEVLYMTDPVDEFWIPSVGGFEEKSFKSVTRAGADLSDIKKEGDEEKDADKTEEEKAESSVDSLVIALKLALGDQVKDVRASDRLTASAVCLVADEAAMDLHLERLLKQHKQLEQTSPRILEINPDHALIKALNAKAGDDGTGDIGEAGSLLLDQARILEGETLPDPSAFARRLADVMAKAFG